MRRRHLRGVGLSGRVHRLLTRGLGRLGLLLPSGGFLSASRLHRRLLSLTRLRGLRLLLASRARLSFSRLTSGLR